MRATLIFILVTRLSSNSRLFWWWSYLFEESYNLKFHRDNEKNIGNHMVSKSPLWLPLTIISQNVTIWTLISSCTQVFIYRECIYTNSEQSAWVYSLSQSRVCVYSHSKQPEWVYSFPQSRSWVCIYHWRQRKKTVSPFLIILS